MKQKGNSGFTLIEMMVVITVITILFIAINSFFNISKRDAQLRHQQSEFYKISDFLSATTPWLSLSGFLTSTDFLSNSFNPTKSEANLLYYTVPYSKFIPTDGVGISADVKSVKTLWIQKCYFLFDSHGKNIAWKPFIDVCDETYIPEWEFNIQGVLLSKSDNISEIKISDRKRKDSVFGYQFNVLSEDELIYDETWIKNTNFKSFDLLLNNPSELETNNVHVVKIDLWNWVFKSWIYFGNTNNLWNEIKEEFIKKIINKARNTLDDNWKIELNNLFNEKSMYLLHNNSREEEYSWIYQILKFNYE